MPAFLWPQRRAAGESLPVRIGRVLHWTGATAGSAAVVIGLAAILFDPSSKTIAQGIAVALLGAAAVLLSRGLRYILAAE